MDENMQEQYLLVDPVLESVNAASQMMSRTEELSANAELYPRAFLTRMSYREISQTTSPSPASDNRHSPFVESADRFVYASKPDSERLTGSEGSEGCYDREDRASKPTPLPDELSTPSDMSTPFLCPFVSADFAIANEFEDPVVPTHASLLFHKSSPVLASQDESLADLDPVFHVKGTRFDQFVIDANLALTDDVELTSGLPSLHQMPSARVQDRWRMSPESLVRAAWSTLQIHLESSLHKLGLVHQTSLVSQFIALPCGNVVDRGMSTALHMMAGGECRSPTDLICFIHLSYAMFLVIHPTVDRESSQELFSQAMSYSHLVDPREQQAYVNMVDALWKPSHMELADIVGLLQGSVFPSALTNSSPRQTLSGVSLGRRGDDPVLRVIEDYLDGG